MFCRRSSGECGNRRVREGSDGTDVGNLSADRPPTRRTGYPCAWYHSDQGFPAVWECRFRTRTRCDRAASDVARTSVRELQGRGLAALKRSQVGAPLEGRSTGVRAIPSLIHVATSFSDPFNIEQANAVRTNAISICPACSARLASSASTSAVTGSAIAGDDSSTSGEDARCSSMPSSRRCN
jgi:hypothetical protein